MSENEYVSEDVSYCWSQGIPAVPLPRGNEFQMYSFPRKICLVELVKCIESTNIIVYSKYTEGINTVGSIRYPTVYYWVNENGGSF